MVTALQGSLLDLCDEPAPGPLGGTVHRTMLSHGAWVDIRPGWMAGAGVLFDRLRQVVPWREERRRMYERVVDVPRLLCFYAEGEQLPDSALDRARQALDAHYWPELGEPLVTAGLCLYRDGQDSVAWHGDRNRHTHHNPLVATVSLGARRRFRLRPVGGRPTLELRPGHGDLVVMGGACQHEWEHTVPKEAAPAGPRMSITLRHSAQLG